MPTTFTGGSFGVQYGYDEWTEVEEIFAGGCRCICDRSVTCQRSNLYGAIQDFELLWGHYMPSVRKILHE